MKIALDLTPDATDLARIARAAQYQASERALAKRVRAAVKARRWSEVRALGEQLRSLQAAAING